MAQSTPFVMHFLQKPNSLDSKGNILFGSLHSILQRSHRSGAKSLVVTSATKDSIDKRMAAPMRRNFLKFSSGIILMEAVQHFVFPGPAFSFGISGPKEWLKSQKQRTSGNLFKPVLASKAKMDTVQELIEAGNFEEAFNVAQLFSLDCLEPERGSFNEFQINSGLQPCTFKLVLKNAASLLDNDDPNKIFGERSLNNLILALQTLTDELQLSLTQDAPNKERLVALVVDTKEAFNKFIDGIKLVLGLPL